MNEQINAVLEIWNSSSLSPGYPEIQVSEVPLYISRFKRMNGESSGIMDTLKFPNRLQTFFEMIISAYT